MKMSLPDLSEELNNKAVKNFQEYLKIPSVHPNVNYDACVKFLKKQAQSLDLPIQVYEVVTGKPIVIITWNGLEANSPSLLLNSHMDVVPVFEDKWTHKPFDAKIDSKGNIYARGSQDMKCVGIQYLEAIRRLKRNGIRLRRTVHISFVPDEEIGGADGMESYVKTEHFKDLNVGVALDEGAASPNNDYYLFYGERVSWHLHFHCPGKPGHGSLLLEDTAGEKVNYILNKFFEFRDKEKQKLKDNIQLNVGDVTAVNLTRMHGGVQSNVIPPEFEFVIDCRIAVTVDLKEWEDTINSWCKEAGSGIWIEYEQKESSVPVTKLDNSNPYWIALKQVLAELNINVTPVICPGATDSRFIRAIGLPAFGFSPINNTPIRLHQHDEYLGVGTFLKGIDIYYRIISGLADLEDKIGERKLYPCN